MEKTGVRILMIDDNQNDLLQIEKIMRDEEKKNHWMFSIECRINADDEIGKYDLYFLDIEIPGTNGFAVGKYIQENDPDAEIVFISSHDEYVFDSFRLKPLYYIRKRNMQEDVPYVLQYFMETHRLREMTYSYVFGNLNTDIPFSSITYFEIAGNELYMHLKTGKELKEYKTMKKLLEEIPKKPFVKVSRNFVVNISMAEKIEGENIILKTGEKIHISRRLFSQVSSAFLEVNIL